MKVIIIGGVAGGASLRPRGSGAVLRSAIRQRQGTGQFRGYGPASTSSRATGRPM